MVSGQKMWYIHKVEYYLALRRKHSDTCCNMDEKQETNFEFIFKLLENNDIFKNIKPLNLVLR